ncbi:MAG: transcription antitermination factor NusB [Bacteroidales bacterium]|nr:transcription antitermination factor NusB [Bacteroidales bacterium]
MLSRRILRVKVLQALYAFLQSDNERIDLGEKELFRSLNKLYENYIYQFSFLSELVEFAGKRIEENKKKFFPTEEDLNPNTRFIDNRFIAQLNENLDFKRYAEAYKINWSEEQEMIRKIYVEIRESDDYKDYMSAAKSGYEEDKEILIRILKKILAKSEILHFYFEERSIYWSEDFFTANLLVARTIKTYEESWDNTHKLPTIFKVNDSDDPEEDKTFVKLLFRKTIVNSEKYMNLIENKVKNWEMDRIAIMDTLLIKMALVELLEFPSIPVKVTLNEYIELAKLYSTPKSKVFVNGVLDKLILDLKNEKTLVKTGRGLLDN